MNVLLRIIFVSPQTPSNALDPPGSYIARSRALISALSSIHPLLHLIENLLPSEQLDAHALAVP